MEIIFSTRNISKVHQVKTLFGDIPVSIISLNEAGILGDVVEDGVTLEENATKKARFAHGQTGKCALADDTGLFIDAWGGKPGIHAARWAGEGKSTEDIMNLTLERLEGIPTDGRTATFTTCAVLIDSSGRKVACTASVRGKILTEPRTTCQPNMPYSAIFVPDGQEKTWAEMTVEEENAISHRGEAFRKMKKVLIDLVG